MDKPYNNIMNKNKTINLSKVEKLENGLFIFRRDLRIVDNKALNLLSEYCNHIYTIFIFTPEQVGNGNKYKSDNSVQFMIESLDDLSGEINKSNGSLHLFYGNNDTVIEHYIKKYNINIVAFNLDITPYAIKRDNDVVKLCEELGVFVIYDYDYYLHQPGTIVNVGNESYQKFTPYYITALKKKVEEPKGFKKLPFKKSTTNIGNKIGINYAYNHFTEKNPDILVHGGRKEGLKTMIKAIKSQSNYSSTHNDLDKQTTQLSAYIKFGCVSIREVYKAFHNRRDIIRQLFWRDFYANVLFSHPNVLGHAMKSNYNKIKWHHNKSWFDAWCDGKTGYPIVDAGMRQLNTTGYMHNRARLIVASFLVKTLLIDWREGEQYFSSKLVDYDPASNNLNWQWCASSAVDSQPYFRIFNPWRQAEEYDPDCKYIKKWVTELKDVPTEDILKWETEWANHKNVGYYKPIVKYDEQKEKALKMYKSALY